MKSLDELIHVPLSPLRLMRGPARQVSLEETLALSSRASSVAASRSASLANNARLSSVALAAGDDRLILDQVHTSFMFDLLARFHEGPSDCPAHRSCTDEKVQRGKSPHVKQIKCCSHCVDESGTVHYVRGDQEEAPHPKHVGRLRLLRQGRSESDMSCPQGLSTFKATPLL